VKVGGAARLSSNRPPSASARLRAQRESDPVAVGGGGAPAEELVAGSNAGAFVGDVDRECVGRVANGDGHSAGTVLPCVVQQHRQNLPDGGLRGRGGGKIARPDAEGAPLGRERAVPVLPDLSEHLGQMTGFDRSGRVPGQREQVVDHLFQTVGRGDRLSYRRPQVLGRRIERRFQREPKTGQRGSQLV
jgi:hypothetical protein